MPGVTYFNIYIIQVSQDQNQASHSLVSFNLYSLSGQICKKLLHVGKLSVRISQFPYISLLVPCLKAQFFGLAACKNLVIDYVSGASHHKAALRYCCVICKQTYMTRSCPPVIQIQVMRCFHLRWGQDLNALCLYPPETLCPHVRTSNFGFT